MSTYKAAYIPGEPDSTSGGIVMTTKEEATLSDEEMMAAGIAFMESEPDLFEGYDESDILIGEWTD